MRWGRAAAVLLVLGLVSRVAAQPRPVTLFVPAFAGPGSLGTNVATVLNLQVWQTLRKAPFPNPAGINFGDGLVLWDTAPLAEPSHAGAARAARAVQADLALWGAAWRYGDGVVVQPYLTFASADRPPIVSVTASGGGLPLSIGLLRSTYDFRPLALSGAFVKRYSNPGALTLFESPTSDVAVGEVGTAFTALQQDRGSALVTSGGARGWIRLPALSSNRSEVVDFTGGLIRLLRGDWEGAASLFQRVVANTSAPTTLKVDAHLYRWMALRRAGGNGVPDLDRARELNPYDRAGVMCLLLSRVARVGQLDAGDPTRRQTVADIERLVAAHGYLFPPGDSWLGQVTAAIQPAR